jgi:sugar lactone lactonase YvrE
MTTTVFDKGLFMPESPRWHAGCLWISDILHRTVFRYDEHGRKHAVAVFEVNQSGIGFAPDGSMLVVSMPDRKLLRYHDATISEVSDLSHLEPTMLNDMVVASDGTAYITRFGWNPWKGEPMQTVSVLKVSPDGTARSMGPELIGPNGVALSPDEATLFVAEAGGSAVWALDLESTAHPAEVFCSLPASPTSELGLSTPDGICTDGAGGLWVADPLGHRVVHLGSDGALDDTVEFPATDHPLSVTLGGATSETLFITIVEKTDLYGPRTEPSGRIETLAPAGPFNRSSE